MAFKSFERLSLPFSIFLLLIIGFVAYGNTLAYPFVHDDIVFIQQNPDIGNLNDIASVFFRKSAFPDNSLIVNSYYRPGLEIFNRVLFRLFGFNPAGYHFVNILIHIFNSVLVFLLLKILTSRKWFSYLIAAIFLVHPIQSQAVACISGVSNLLFAFASLMSFLFYLYCDRQAGQRVSLYYWGISLVFFLAGLFIKEQTIVLPVLIGVYEIFCGRSARRKSGIRALHILTYGVALLGYLGFRSIVLGTSLAGFLVYEEEFWLRIMTIPQTVTVYLSLLAFPHNLHYYRAADILAESLGWGPFVVVLTAISGAMILLLPRAERNVFGFGTAWFLIMLLPTLNIVPLVIEFSYISTAEHFLYLPMVGFFLSLLLFIRWVAFKIFSVRAFENLAVSGFIGFVSILAVLTIRQNTVWRGEIPLFQRTLKFEPHLARVHVLLGRAYYFAGENFQALQEYETALAIFDRYLAKAENPEVKKFYLGYIKGIHFDIAHCYEAVNNFPVAIEHYQVAISIDPSDGVLFNNAGSLLARTGNIPLASKYFKEAIRINPHDLNAMNNLAICFIENREREEAKRMFEKILSIDSHFTAAEQNLKKLQMESVP